MSKKLLINCVYGQEDAERATLPFIVANVAATADQESLVFLTAEAVRIATRGYAEPIRAHGMKPLAEVMQSYLDNVAAGGRKMINDSLVTAGVLGNDSWAHVVGWTDHFVVDRRRPGVEVEIREQGAQGA